MNKKLILCRHAQAEPALPGVSDFDRPLTAAGIAQATEAGKWLASRKIKIDGLVTSPATRARQTAQLLAGQTGLNQLFENSRIYEASPTTLLAVVNNLPDEVRNVLLVGHNPGLSYLATILTGHRYDLDTSQLVVIQLQVSAWAMVSGGTGSQTS